MAGSMTDVHGLIPYNSSKVAVGNEKEIWDIEENPFLLFGMIRCIEFGEIEVGIANSISSHVTGSNFSARTRMRLFIIVTCAENFRAQNL